MAFRCPQCGTTSYSPMDEAQGYCGNCHDWTGGSAAPMPERCRVPITDPTTGEVRAAWTEHGVIEWHSQRRPLPPDQLTPEQRLTASLRYVLACYRARRR